MKTHVFTSLRAVLVFTVLTGLIYPLVMTAFAHIAFPRQAEGSLIEKEGRVVGSRLIAQKTEDPRLFAFRPSAADYATLPSGASNLSPASRAFVDAVKARQQAIGENAPADLLTASGSGLDPHVSPEGARYQIARVAQARGIDPVALARLVDSLVEPKTFGFLGQARVNLMNLNAALVEKFPERK